MNSVICVAFTCFELLLGPYRALVAVAFVFNVFFLDLHVCDNFSTQNADKIQVTFFLATSGASLEPSAPLAEYIPGI